MHGPRVGGQGLRQGRHVVPLVSLQVVRLHAGEVAALIPPPDHVQVLIQAAGEETRPPEEGGVRSGDIQTEGSRRNARLVIFHFNYSTAINVEQEWTCGGCARIIPFKLST